MTKLLQRLHDELVHRHYATTTRESYLKILKAFHRTWGSGWTTSVPTISAATKSTYSKSGGWPWARSWHSWPRPEGPTPHDHRPTFDPQALPPTW